MKKILKSLFISGFAIIFLLANSNVINVQAKNPKKESSNYTFLLKNPNQLKKFLKELDPEKNNLDITVIEEIGLVYINNHEELNNPEEELVENNKNLESYIEDRGSLPKFEITLTEPNAIQKNNMLLTKVNTKEIENTQFPHLSSLDLFPFNWYLSDVTNNFTSQSINTGKNTNIALIDSGVESSHPLLSNNLNLNKAKNYTSEKLGVYDEMGHGTSVAGIITSIAPETTIVPYKVLGEKDGESIWVLEAIIDAANDGNDIINLSLGTYKSTGNYNDKLLIKAFELAVNYAKKKDVLVVSSSGNRGNNLDELKKLGEMHLPGSIKDVITVSSNTKLDTLASYSNIGKDIDFSAPGGDIDENFDITGLVITTFPSDRPNSVIDQIIGIPIGYTLSYGTSLTAPQVSATAALIVSKYNTSNKKDAKVNDIIKSLKNGAVDIGAKGYDISFGYGKINAYQSLTKMK